MDRRGPKQGHHTRAIAQTTYAVTWTIDWRAKGGGCAVAKTAAVVTITYNYPEVTDKMAPALAQRWRAFMAGVRKHEETHGHIALEMVDAVERRLAGLSMKKDRRCANTQAEVKKRVAAVYAEYEARQDEFDRVEHGDGGTVERLVERLAGEE